MNKNAIETVVKNNEIEIKQIESAIKENKEKRMHIRLKVILHHLNGRTNINIAEIENLCEQTVGIYVNAYKKNSIKGLVMGKSSGAPRKLTNEHEKQLFEVITTKLPDEVGFPSRKNWDSNIIGQWVQNNFNIKYSPRGMLEVLHRLNLSYTRPTYTLVKADPIKQEEFKQEFEVLKKLNL